MLGTVYKMSDTCIPSELWVVSSPDPTLSRGETFLAGRRARAGHETKLWVALVGGQTTLVPSTVVSAKATDTLGSQKSSAVKLWRK